MNKKFFLFIMQIFIMAGGSVMGGNLAYSQVPKFIKVKIGTTTAWKDLASGIIVGNIKDNVGSLQEAQTNCPAPWRAPSYGNSEQKGASGDLAILFKNGVLSVYPKLIGKSFWLTDVSSPYFETIEFTRDAAHPVLYNYGASDGSISSVCITK